ncbi:MAG: hypothetical protein H6686_04480 [Fibrobacteria bacterium]|nr:hypothetical protein [Fibrobacteria bacterium]
MIAPSSGDHFRQVLAAFATQLEARFDTFLAEPLDRDIAQGNLVFVAVHESGEVFGRYWGTDPVRQRQSAMVAWTKVNQVKLTRTATGLYEKLVYAGQKNWWEFGIPLPEFIGWEGGMPALLDDGTFAALAFSGLRGDKDCELMAQAASATPGIALLAPEIP